MTYRWRMGLFFLGAAGLAVMYGLIIARMPTPHANPYGEAINRLSAPQRHVTDGVTSVNFDYRGFDTLGEEFILFVSVMGAIVLLREQYEKKRETRIDALTSPRRVGPSDAIRVWTLAMTGPTVLFGLYVIIHGQLTPGGGFQGGVILATAPLLIYLAEGFDVFKRVTSNRLTEITEAIGAATYALIGVLGCILGAWFLQNVLPLGGQNQPNWLSGGTVPLINFSVGVEVAAGFTLLLAAFLQSLLSEEAES